MCGMCDVTMWCACDYVICVCDVSMHMTCVICMGRVQLCAAYVITWCVSLHVVCGCCVICVRTICVVWMCVLCVL